MKNSIKILKGLTFNCYIRRSKFNFLDQKISIFAALTLTKVLSRSVTTVRIGVVEDSGNALSSVSTISRRTWRIVEAVLSGNSTGDTGGKGLLLFNLCASCIAFFKLNWFASLVLLPICELFTALSTTWNVSTACIEDTDSSFCRENFELEFVPGSSDSWQIAARPI